MQLVYEQRRAGTQRYSGEMMFTWIGAAVDIPHKVHKYLASLGTARILIILGLSSIVSSNLLLGYSWRSLLILVTQFRF